MGLIFAATLSIIIAVFSVLFIALEFYVGVIGYIKGAPFVPSKGSKIKTMIELADIKQGMIAVDLGSGDGAIVLAAAKQGAVATGVDINPFLIPYSRWRAKRAGLAERATFIRSDIKNYSLHNTDVVFCYLLPPLLAAIAPKLISELKPGSRVVSNAFRIKGLTPVAEKDGVFLYII